MNHRTASFAVPLAFAAVGLFQALAPATSSSEDAAPTQSAEKLARPLTRVVTIGASMTDGLFLPADLAAVFETMLTSEHATVRGHSSAFFFANPEKSGRTAIDFVVDAQPTMVVALDFLFWFGYGAIGADHSRIQSEDDRLALLERGLEFLDGIEVPLVVGDFPDMSDAVGRGMLAASQQPEAATLERLNERVHAWAAEREHTIVVPLAGIVASMRSGKPFSIGQHRWPAHSTGRVLLRDNLHPSLEGLAAITHLIGALILENHLAREDEIEIDLPTILDSFGLEFEDAPERTEASKRPL